MKLSFATPALSVIFVHLYERSLVSMSVMSVCTDQLAVAVFVSAAHQPAVEQTALIVSCGVFLHAAALLSDRR